MPFEIPAPPPQSWFCVDRDDQGQPRLTWAEPCTWRSYLLTAGLSIGFTALLAWFTHPIFMPVLANWNRVFRNGPPPNFLLGVLMVVVHGIVVLAALGTALMMCWVVYAILRIPKPDRLILGPSALRYESEEFSRLRSCVRDVPRSALGEIRLDRVQDYPGLEPRPRLTLDNGAQRFEIGKDLREADREWLAGVLRMWARETQPPATDAPGSIPDAPANSSIQVLHSEPGRLELRWKAVSPGTGPARWTGAAQIGVWLLVWTIFEVIVSFSVMAILLGRWQAWGIWQGLMLAVMVPWLVGWTLGGLFAIGQLRGLLRPSTALLTLTPVSLDYKPGRSFDGGQVRSDPSRLVPREEIGEVRLERTPDAQRLTVDHGAERIEIGPTLGEPDRQWLADVLAAWAQRSNPSKQSHPQGTSDDLVLRNIPVPGE